MGRTRNRLEPGAGVGARTVPRFREGRGGLRCVRYPADRAARGAQLTGGPLSVVPRLRDVVELSGHHHEILHHLAARRAAGGDQRRTVPSVWIRGGRLFLLRDRRRVRELVRLQLHHDTARRLDVGDRNRRGGAPGPGGGGRGDRERGGGGERGG